MWFVPHGNYFMYVSYLGSLATPPGFEESLILPIIEQPPINALLAPCLSQCF